MPQESAAIPSPAAETMPLVPEVTPEGSEASEGRLPHSCRCGARWSGGMTAHCAGSCHRTFTRPSNFDRHRRGGQCVDPATVGLVPRGYRNDVGSDGILWSLPGRTETAEEGNPMTDQESALGRLRKEQP
jgi:hypothetical protein